MRLRKGKWWYRGYAIRYWETPSEWRAKIADAPEYAPFDAESSVRARAMAECMIDELIAVGRLGSHIAPSGFAVAHPSLAG